VSSPTWPGRAIALGSVHCSPQGNGAIPCPASPGIRPRVFSLWVPASPAVSVVLSRPPGRLSSRHVEALVSSCPGELLPRSGRIPLSAHWRSRPVSPPAPAPRVVSRTRRVVRCCWRTLFSPRGRWRLSSSKPHSGSRYVLLSPYVALSSRPAVSLPQSVHRLTSLRCRWGVLFWWPLGRPHC
jgi:hypothetical protein